MSSGRGIEEGRKTFANTLKYVLTTMSANLGNMISMAAASLFLPFLPLLAGQILLNNFLSDVPAIGIADDAVDPELVERPQRWNMRFIGRFMVEFGAVSSVFDFLTFGVLLLVFRAGPDAVPDGLVRRIAAHRAGHRAGGAHPPALLPKPAGTRAAVVDGVAHGADLRDALSALDRGVRVRAVAGSAVRHGRRRLPPSTSSRQRSPRVAFTDTWSENSAGFRRRSMKGRRSLPGPHSAGVDVHEVGRGIIPDTAAPDSERRLPKCGERHIGEPDVDGLPLHVQAAGRNPFAVAPKHVVGGG